jgi:hypothetical protein
LVTVRFAPKADIRQRIECHKRTLKKAAASEPYSLLAKAHYLRKVGPAQSRAL